MARLADWEIRSRVKIVPFEEGIDRPGKISYGLTSYGYDIRVGRKFKVLETPHPHNTDWFRRASPIIDPKDNACFRESFRDVEGDVCMIPPNSFALAESVEWVEVPRDCIAICVGKSTYARVGLIVNTTPLEPEWRGKITIEISNTTPSPAIVYAEEGIMQVIFFAGDLGIPACERSYADKKGKYQDQKGLTLPIVK